MGTISGKLGKFKKMSITFNIDLGKHMELAPNLSHLETMFGKRNFLKTKIVFFFIFNEIGMTGNTAPR